MMWYAPDFGELYPTAGLLVGKVLDVARPADPPVEEPRRLEFVANLTTRGRSA
ncbi:MAG: hypothetical protein ACREMB_10735 [Candidatus Rokuibacteriota bacterium]